MRDKLAVNKSANHAGEADGHSPDEGLCHKVGRVLECGYHPAEVIRTHHPPQNLVWMLRLIITQTHYRGRKRFITHIMSFLGRANKPS